MLPKVGDIVTYIFDPKEFSADWSKVPFEFKIISATAGGFKIVGIYGGAGHLRSFGDHMFTQRRYGTWTCKESNVQRILREVDEVQD